MQTTKITHKETPKPLVLYIAETPEEPEVFSYGWKIGYACEPMPKQVERVFDARLLVVWKYNFYFFKHISVCNLAVHYDVPLVWVNRYALPWRWMASFDLCLVGDPEPIDFWRTVCHEVL